jgi:putative ABC transport system permease protein
MAWVNFVNLSTATAVNRAKEVGLRKVVGASRRQLMVQFFFEIILTNLIASVAGCVLISLVQPLFAEITGLPGDYTVWLQSGFWLMLAGMFLVGVVLSGLFPVIALSSFKPVTVLRGKLARSGRGAALRKALVVLQFMVGAALVVATFTVYHQLAFMQSQDVGFAMDRTLVVSMPRVRDDATYPAQFESFRETLLRRHEIAGISHVTEVPGRQIYWDNGAIFRVGQDHNEGKNYQIVGIDHEFADLFELEFVAGRNISRDFPADTGALIMNETAVRWMGFESAEAAVGSEVDYWGQIFPIVGVVKDYHQQSLKEAFEPHLFRYVPYGRGSMGRIVFKLNPGDTRETVASVKKEYETFFPGNTFDYFFLDDYYNQQYDAERLFGRVYSLFSLLALFVIALGTYGLSSFSVSQLTHEIGIRKVLGASVTNVVRMLTREYVILVVLANLIAWPIAWYAMNGWLENFAFRTEIGILTFLVAGLATLVLALLTVSYQTVKAAVANPADAIQQE